MASINLPTATKQDAIKTAVDGIDTKATTINTNVNNANTNINSLLSKGNVKSVQRGLTNLSDGGPSINVTINAVNVNKSIVILHSYSSNANGYFSAIQQLNSPTNLNISKPTTTYTVVVDWQVIEFY